MNSILQRYVVIVSLFYFFFFFLHYFFIALAQKFFTGQTSLTPYTKQMRKLYWNFETLCENKKKWSKKYGSFHLEYLELFLT